MFISDNLESTKRKKKKITHNPKATTINILASATFENFCHVLADIISKLLWKKGIPGGGARNVHF